MEPNQFKPLCRRPSSSTRSSDDQNPVAAGIAPPGRAEAYGQTVTASSSASNAPQVAGSGDGAGKNDGNHHGATPLAEPDLWERAMKRLSDEDQKWIQHMATTPSPSTASDGNTVDELIGLVDRLRLDCEGKKWRWAEGPLRASQAWLNKFKDVGDIVTQYDPTHLALPWAGVRFILICTLQYNDNMDTAADSIAMATRIIHRYKVYELIYSIDTVGGDVRASLDVALINLYAGLWRLLVRVGQFFEKRTGPRFAHGILKPHGLADLLSDIEMLETEAGKAASLCKGQQDFHANQNAMRTMQLLEGLLSIHEPVLRIDQNVLSVLEKMGGNEMYTILEWTSPIKYTFHHRFISEQRTAGTCEWITQRSEYRGWLSESSSVTLWVQAPAGRGKTYLTSMVIDSIQTRLQQDQSQEAFAFFYCNYLEQDRRSALSVLRSYVRQLATPKHLGSRIHPRLKELHSDSRKYGEDWTMKQCEEYFVALLNFYPRTTLLLDALDECGVEDRTSLLNLFHSLETRVGKPVKIFIASRPEGDIRERLLLMRNIEINETNNSEDIMKYITEGFELHAPWTRLLNRNAALKQRLIDALIEKSHGMFQYVNLQISDLRTLSTETDMISKLASLPDGLNETYERIHERILNGGEYSASITHRALKWVTCAFEPLTSRDLLEVVRVDVEDETVGSGEEVTEEDLSGWCANLLTIDVESYPAVWRPCHFSVVEHLQTMWPRLDTQQFVAKACLVFLLSMPSSPPTHRRGLVDPDSYVSYQGLVHVKAQDLPNPDIKLARLLKAFLGSPVQGSSRFGSWLRLNENGSLGLFQTPSPIITMTYYGLYNLLRDWWHRKDSAFSDLLLTERGPKGDNALAYAAHGGSVEICSLLIERGVPLNPMELGGRWRTPLNAAVESGNISIVRLFLDKGADVRHRDTPIVLNAMQSKHPSSWDILEMLVQYGADVEQSDPGSIFHGNTPLQRAVLNGDSQKVDRLIELGADVNAPLGYLGSPLALAASERSVAMLESLLRKGAKVDLLFDRKCDYQNALDAAIRHNHLGAMEILIERGADVNFQLNGWNPLLQAMSGGWTEGIECLISRGAEVNMILSGEYGSVLIAAVARRRPEVIKLILQHGADVNLRVDTGVFKTALEAARGWPDIFATEDIAGEACTQLLLRFGAHDI